MKISRKTYNKLATLLAGDTQEAAYLRGSELVEFFNECGFDDVYESGFPSRWAYAAEKIEKSNESGF